MGVKQWIFQRISNLIFVLFGFWLLVNLAGTSNISLATLLADGTVKTFLTVVLLFAGLNSVLAGWQIAGDYAQKINVSENLIVGFCAVVSAAYLVVGLGLLY